MDDWQGKFSLWTYLIAVTPLGQSLIKSLLPHDAIRNTITPLDT
jgi:hypothetical protein